MKLKHIFKICYVVKKHTTHEKQYCFQKEHLTATVMSNDILEAIDKLCKSESINPLNIQSIHSITDTDSCKILI